MPRLKVPSDLKFEELALEVDDTGLYRFHIPALTYLCVFNGKDPEKVMADGDECSVLVGLWYLEHRSKGGARSAAAESIFRGVLERDEADRATSGAMRSYESL